MEKFVGCSIPNKSSLITVTILIPFCLLFLTAVAGADFYKYKDKNGNWVFSDTPGSGSEKMEVIQTNKPSTFQHKRTKGFIDIESQLKDRFRPENEVERASISTVTIKTSLGTGSGFFITSDGYILTNRHVLKFNEEQVQKGEEFFDQIDNKLDSYETKLYKEAAILKRNKERLDDFKKEIDNIPYRNRQEAYKREYERRLEEHKEAEEQYNNRRNKFLDNKWKYNDEKLDFKYKAQKAERDSQFTIILKDSTELDADLIAVSKTQDLALLKIDSCRSPYLEPLSVNNVAQGMKVFAIGSPVGLSDSVTSGIVSGFMNDYIKTNAKIYPGNSGGPLITTDGKVIGINTLKLITQKYEGLGFAITIDKAYDEFFSESLR